MNSPLLLALIVFQLTYSSVNANLAFSDIQVSWINDASMRIDLPGDNNANEILLTVSSPFPGQKIPCLFSGKIRKDPESKITVSGCKSSNVTNLSIKSDLVQDGFVELVSINGKTYKFEPLLNELKGDSDKAVGRKKRALTMTSEKCKALYKIKNWVPNAVTLRTNIMYDLSLKEHFGGSDQRTMQWVASVVELTKPLLAKLDLSIELVVDEVGFLDRKIKPKDMDVDTLRPSSLTSYFCLNLKKNKEDEIVGGKANTDAACNKNGRAVIISSLWTEENSALETSAVFAHEIGHSVGMPHNEDDQYRDECKDDGIMNEKRKKGALKWTFLSNWMFKRNWVIGLAKKCMKPFYRPSVYRYRKRFQISAANLLTTLKWLSKSFIVSFDLKLSSFDASGYRSVLQLTTRRKNDSQGKYGKRTPAIFLKGNRLHIASAINGNSNHYVDIQKPLTKGRWYQISINADNTLNSDVTFSNLYTQLTFYSRTFHSRYISMMRMCTAWKTINLPPLTT